MLFSKPYFALDVGSHSLKLVEYADRSQNQVQTLICEPLTESVFVDDDLADPVLASEIIREVFVKHQFVHSGKKAVVCLPPSAFAIYRKTYTVGDFDELRDRIFYDTRQLFAENFHNLVFRFRILNNYGSFDKAQDVVLVGAKVDLIESFLDVLRTMGLKVPIIDCPQFALLNLAESSALLGGFKVLLNVGARYSDVLIVEDERIQFAHTLDFGGNLYTDHIAERLQVSWAEAEAIKIAASQPGELTDGGVLQELQAVHQAFAQQVAQVIKEYRLESDFAADIAFNEVLLAGGGAKTAGLAGELAAALHYPVVMVDQFLPPNAEEILPAQAAVSGFGVAGGLALRRPNDWLG